MPSEPPPGLGGLPLWLLPPGAGAAGSPAASSDRSDDRTLKRLRRLLRAKDRVDAAPHEDWPVARLADVSGISEAYFARAFRDAFGTPPHRYVLARRVERAAVLLGDTGLSITEIAFRTGWNSLGSFGRTFRDITGESPGDLRQRMRGRMGALQEVPHCFIRAAGRPDLTMAVSEKRRRDRAATVAAAEEELS